MPTLQSQLRIGGYELARLLGEGGMGEVWLAQDEAAGRQVALKFIRPHLLFDPGFRKRFGNEAKTLGKLEHDRIVSLYAVLDEGEHLALVLRFIDGQSLAHRIDSSQGLLPLSFVMACARDILPALGFAHENGIIHRDIKPENILVDSRNRCFLMDFGIAVADFAERGTVTGFAVGTPHYMSPEQIRTPGDLTIQNRGHRSDIYSFGVVLFEMLSGRVPFGQHSGVQDTYEIQRAHCSDPPPPLKEVNPEVSSAIADVVMWCLEKYPDQRPQSCAELLQALEGAMAGDSWQTTARTATIVEPRPSAAKPKAAVQPVVIPPAGRKVPRNAWYGLGAIVIGAAIGITVWTSSGKVSSGGNVNVPPHNTAEVPPPAGGPAPKRTDYSRPKPKPTATSVEIIRKPSEVSTPPPVPPQEPPSDKEAINKLAEQKFNSGNDLFKEGQYCASLRDLNEAVRLNPKAEYRTKRDNAVTGCNTQ